MSGTRRASHAGSWYSSDASELSQSISNWLEKASSSYCGSSPVQPPTSAQLIIAPHAGFNYSGETAAFAYETVAPTRVRRVFLLGPSHHFFMEGCAVTGFGSYNTPLGSLPVDNVIREKLLKTGSFEVMTPSVDEEEHSLELHLPYIAYMFGGRSDVTIVPVLVGNLSTALENHYGEIFSPYLYDPANLFVVSSDFCHWGKRFNFQPFDRSKGEIWQCIEAMDREGMSIIESKDAGGFTSYLCKCRNTICGRHPIGVILRATKQRDFPRISFVHYKQSSKCRRMGDSSASFYDAFD